MMQVIPAPAEIYFAEDETGQFAGRHLLLDMWGGQGLADIPFIESTLLAASRAAGATVLHAHFHPFGEGQGITGVLLLAESHMSIHTWPEVGFAALDIFMCASCDPMLALPVIRDAFQPQRLIVNPLRRGVISPAVSPDNH
ncbi:adenosylmethionine decarboxylase [Leeia oryzae]|uniref:adenosylmethionine decarboxylase n=1 Tax=Leeia oryzae TaxID=356662 RepID=UPI00035DCA83|nr:adenosylmethionine decarboxylase [Leeia oryzae]